MGLLDILGFRETNVENTPLRTKCAAYIQERTALLRKIADTNVAEILSSREEKTYNRQYDQKIGFLNIHKAWAEYAIVDAETRGRTFAQLVEFDHADQRLRNDFYRTAANPKEANSALAEFDRIDCYSVLRFLMNGELVFDDREFAIVVSAFPHEVFWNIKRFTDQAVVCVSRGDFDHTYSALINVFLDASAWPSDYGNEHYSDLDFYIPKPKRCTLPGIEEKLVKIAENRILISRCAISEVLPLMKNPALEKFRADVQNRFETHRASYGGVTFIELSSADCDLLAEILLKTSVFAEKPKPSKKWLSQEASQLVVRANYLPLLKKVFEAKFKLHPRYGRFFWGHDITSIFKGLIFSSILVNDISVCSLLANFALNWCFKSIKGIGIHDEQLGNACLWALINREDGAGVPHLARLLVRTKYPKVKKKISAALDDAAKRSGVSRGELEEMALSHHGLSGDGTCVVPVGQGQARIAIKGATSIEIMWKKEGGEWTSSIPKALSSDKPAIADVRKRAKEIAIDLSVLVQRIQQAWLENRTWSFEKWKQIYFEHPLRRAFSESLIWKVQGEVTTFSALWRNGHFENHSGMVIAVEKAEISLWHPMSCPVAETLAWRKRLRELDIRQPFKQASREVYLLTPAELATRIYSNRFAGHVLKQHQMMTLARLNGWSVTHRIWADTPNNQPTHLVIPAFRLVAEYWTEGAGVDDPETTDSQAYLYLTTDQLRFYRITNPDEPVKNFAFGPERGEAVAIADVPKLVLSEVMRHCDLFVGVASIANDPQWRDRGANSAHPNQWRRTVGQAYWEGQAFGDLNQSSESRKELLEELLPTMAIGKAAKIEGKFLYVTGKLRSYKIHLGSGNILMEPNDAYLCVVPKRSISVASEPATLPYDGDGMLAVILSKAILLAADDKVKDESILRQIAGK